MKNLILLASLLISTSVFADVTCSPTANGGYSCFDYQRGTYTQIDRNPNGGYRTFNYGNGSTVDITPRSGGGYNTFNYRNGRSSSITPTPNGGFEIRHW